ncbi:hypothetical protein [Streptomyces sp. NPDC002221]|uniref:hypothetical protein n=1 Tax=Streptomyces sp. NPDC002221 TaxID=3364639 RepID=UPI0036CB5CE0
MAVAGEDLGDDFGVEYGTADGHAFEGVQKGIDIGYAVCEEAVGPAVAVGQEFGCVRALDVLR